MNKKYQVFVSSTFTDLKDERQAAVEAILKAGHIPAGMELFKAGKSQLETIKRWIDESDIYLLILGGRYGSIDEETGKSYTHLEYEYALSKKMPVFAVVINDEMTNSKLKNDMLPNDVLELKNSKEYNEFKEFVKTKIVNFASNLAEVKLAVHENIHQFESDNKLIGWIRGNISEENEILKEKNIKLTGQISTLKLENEKSKIKDLAKTTFASGVSYEEMKKLLEKSIIEVNKKYNLHDKDLKVDLLTVFVSLGDRYSLGVSNSMNMAIQDEGLFFVIAPRLIKFGLLERKTNPKVAYSTITLSEDGKKFLRLFELEKLKTKE